MQLQKRLLGMYGVSKRYLLDPEASELSSRVALGETQVTSGTKNAFKKAGVNVESLEELAKGKVDGMKRSNHVLLEKNCHMVQQKLNVMMLKKN